jgi:hypothetical protein
LFPLLPRFLVGIDRSIEAAAKFGSRILAQRRQRVRFLQQAPALAHVGQCGSLSASPKLDQSLDDAKYRETLGDQSCGTFPFRKGVLQLFRTARGLDQPLVTGEATENREHRCLCRRGCRGRIARCRYGVLQPLQQLRQRLGFFVGLRIETHGLSKSADRAPLRRADAVRFEVKPGVVSAK